MVNYKFRLWDKENKEFLENGFDTEYLINMYGDVLKYEDYDFGGYTTETSVSLVKNIEISQYTNMKDEKGREIYEGDILFSLNKNGIFLQLIGFGSSSSEKECNNMINGFMVIDEKELISGFEFIDMNNIIKDIVFKNDIPYEYNGSDYFIYHSWYVVGNKWENPELMKLIYGKDCKKE